MKIAVNTRLVQKDRMDGIGWFTYETMTRISAAHPEHQFFFLFDRPYDKEFNFGKNVTPVIVRPITRIRPLLKFWHRFSVPRVLKKIKADLYLSPDFFLPPALPCPGIVVIHDLNFEHFPEFLPLEYRKLYPFWTRQAAETSTRILTVSYFSKQDIIEKYNISAEKIDVVFCGVNSFIQPVSDFQIANVKHLYGIDSNYMIVPGTLHPRKNTQRIIEAFGKFRQHSAEAFKLVFAGNNRWMTAEMKQSCHESPFRDDIIFTGRVGESQMNALIQGAHALVFVSLFEGFGLPILEAARAGIPALTSNNTSMKEIAGDSALLVNPYSPEEIAEGMNHICNNYALRYKLVQKSISLPDIYSWDKTSELIWTSIIKVLT